MKKACGITAVLLLSLPVLYRANAAELCESQDYYDLGDGLNCSIEPNKPGNQDSYQDAMFEIMKNHPFERKDMFVELLQRKLEVIDNYEAKQQIRGRSDDIMPTLSKLEDARRVLLGQLERVNTATADNWISVREDARKAIEETSRNLREVGWDGSDIGVDYAPGEL